MLDHLVRCEDYQGIWKMIEEETCEEVKNMLQEECSMYKNIVLQDLERRIFGENKEERMVTRSHLIQDLILRQWKKKVESLIKNQAAIRRALDIIVETVSVRFR